MIKVLLVDDHPMVRAGYARMLLQDDGIQVVAEAGNADEAYRLFVLHSPDITITDVSMPGVGGLGLVHKIHARQPQAKLLVCSMYDSPLLIERVFQSGASGFVSKNAQPDTLLLAIRQVYAGKLFNSESEIQQDATQTLQVEAQRVASLTPREYEIVRLLTLRHSVAECADMMHLSQKTVSNHQTQIKEKLLVPTLAAMVHLALRHGVIPATRF
ncbi:MAG: response regulator [Limnohabitans sp.]